MKKVCFVNGSPRESGSTSAYFIGEIQKLIKDNDIETQCVYAIKDLKSGKIAQSFEKIVNSDSVIFVFPLYVDSIPSNFLDFLWKLESYIKENEIDKNKLPDLYGIINCGFVEGVQNRNAVNIIYNFSKKTGFEFKFVIGIGGGEFIKGTKDIIPIESEVKRDTYLALCKLKDSIESGREDDEKGVFVSPKVPRSQFILNGNNGWVKMVKENNMTKEDLLKKVY
ncbi:MULTISPECIES: hypothetical protein [Clostridium]|uniref:Uncharacterized protein n=1 Tax=Clostridium ragsdalei P11 TaxID=1353534 RepID=A0A1A6AI35_9CLOT|nr:MULTISPECIES: hypothetical protein [Clostridium]OBR89711.1 hypothetical protein CLRAG_39730 [Clostridium ragsdalei P11]QXE21022.1 hypothetical protein B5S50_20410 [Clostridium sp. 001]